MAKREGCGELIEMDKLVHKLVEEMAWTSLVRHFEWLHCCYTARLLLAPAVEFQLQRMFATRRRALCWWIGSKQLATKFSASGTEATV